LCYKEIHPITWLELILVTVVRRNKLPFFNSFLMTSLSRFRLEIAASPRKPARAQRSLVKHKIFFVVSLPRNLFKVVIMSLATHDDLLSAWWKLFLRLFKRILSYKILWTFFSLFSYGGPIFFLSFLSLILSHFFSDPSMSIFVSLLPHLCVAQQHLIFCVVF
jgi:hypothetical protein